MRRYLLAAGLVLLAACSSTPAAVAPTPRESAQAKYIATLDQQLVRYRDQATAVDLANSTCDTLNTGDGSTSSHETYAAALLTLKDVSSRDAGVIVTAVENSGWCKVR